MYSPDLVIIYLLSFISFRLGCILGDSSQVDREDRQVGMDDEGEMKKVGC
jgi:hypothetical protein